jgi:hypothetical protein
MASFAVQLTVEKHGFLDLKVIDVKFETENVRKIADL